MLIKEIKAEIWYVLVICLMMIWTIMICDIKYRLSSKAFCDQWNYNLDAPIPNGTDKAMFSEPKYKPKYRMKNKI